MLRKYILIVTHIFLVMAMTACTSAPTAAPPPVGEATLKGNFRSDPATAVMCDPVKFTPQLETGGTGRVLEYAYDFGDGSKPLRSKQGTIEHTFVKAGRFQVAAKIFSEGGSSPLLEQPVFVDVTPGAECTYIVSLNAPLGSQSLRGQALQATATDLVNGVGGTLVTRYEKVFSGFAARLSPDQANSVRSDATVSTMAIDSKAKTEATDSVAGSWGIDRIDQRTGTNGKYAYTGTGSGVDVYVIDTGVRASHAEFGNRVRPGYNALEDSNDSSDCNGHGTHVAGTIAGETVGVAKQATVIPVKVFDCNGNGATSRVIRGIDWVLKNRDPNRPSVVNLSLGLRTQLDVETMLDLAIRSGLEQGLSFVLAAGNQANNACLYSPSRLGNGDAITVGAIDKNDQIANYSNWGGCVDVFAPGTEIRSASFKSDNDFALLDGTSMAAPHVAGAAAIYLETHPNAKPAEVQGAILAASSANKISMGNTDKTTPNKLLFLDPSATQGSLGAGVDLQPAVIEMVPGGQQQFVATVTGLSSTSVTWSFSSGSVSQTGNTISFTAPQTTGAYYLTATSVADPSKKSTAVVVVLPPRDVGPSQVTLTSSTNTVREPQMVTLEASIGNTKYMSHVEFYEGGLKIGETTEKPFRLRTYVGIAKAATHQFHAVAYSELREQISSTAITITVDPVAVPTKQYWGSVYGNVKDYPGYASGLPIRLRLNADPITNLGGFDLYTTTDSAGNYRFEGLPTGNGTVRPIFDDFRSQIHLVSSDLNVSIVNGVGSATVEKNLLIATRNVSASRIKAGVSCAPFGDSQVLGALTPTGEIYTWGYSKNYNNNAPGTRYDNSPMPVYSPGGGQVDSVTPNEFEFMRYGLLARGSDKTVGVNSITGFTTPLVPNPASLSASCAHVATLDQNGALSTMGSNGSGQLGDGTFTDSSAAKPVSIAKGTLFSAVSTGPTASAAVQSNGDVWFWGDGVSTPLVVAGSASSVSVGLRLITVLKTDGTVWVRNGDQPFVSIEGMRNIVKISSRANHVLALRNDGSVWAWGRNGSGQLGDGTFADRGIAVLVRKLTRIVAIDTTNTASIALKADGTVWTWGTLQSAPVVGNEIEAYPLKSPLF